MSLIQSQFHFELYAFSNLNWNKKTKQQNAHSSFTLTILYMDYKDKQDGTIFTDNQTSSNHQTILPHSRAQHLAMSMATKKILLAFSTQSF